jgi:hypothetical protein
MDNYLRIYEKHKRKLQSQTCKPKSISFYFILNQINFYHNLNPARNQVQSTRVIKTAPNTVAFKNVVKRKQKKQTNDKKDMEMFSKDELNKFKLLMQDPFDCFKTSNQRMYSYYHL